MRALVPITLLSWACEPEPAARPAGPADPLAIQVAAPEYCGDFAVLRVAADRDLTVDTSLLPPHPSADDTCFFDLLDFTVPLDEIFARCESGRGFADVVTGFTRYYADDERPAVIPAEMLSGKEGVYLVGSDLCVGTAIVVLGDSDATTTVWSPPEGEVR